MARTLGSASDLSSSNLRILVKALRCATPAIVPGATRRSLPTLIVGALFIAPLLSFPGSAQEVRLQLDEYHRMLSRAKVAPLSPTPAAGPFALEQASLNIDLGATTARVTTRLSVSIFAEGWQEIPLATSGQVLSIEVKKAEPGAPPALEARLESAGRQLLARGIGRHVIVLEEALDLGVQAGATRDRRDLYLRLPAAASVFGSIKALPGDQLHILSGGAMIETPADGWRFVGVPDGTLRLFAQGDGPVAPTSDLPLRFSASVSSELHLWRTRTTLSATFSANVLQGSLERIEITLPEGYEMQHVDAEALSGWDVESGILTARLLRPERSHFSFSFRLGAPLKGEVGDFTSPVFTVPRARRTRLVLGLTVHGAGILDLIEAGSAIERDIESGARPLGSRSPSKSANTDTFQRSPAYQLNDPTRPPRWKLVWPDQTEVLALRVDSLVLDALVGAKGKALVNLTLDVSNRGSQSLQLNLPDGFRLVRAERDGLRIRPGTLGSGSSPLAQNLALPLVAGTLNHRFTITGVLPVSPVEPLAGRNDLVLMLPSLSAPVTSVLVRAELPDSWRYRLADPARVSSASQLAAAGVSRSLLKVPPGFVVLHAGWSAMSSQPGALRIKVLEQRNREEWF